jgi:hypothetical protein
MSFVIVLGLLAAAADDGAGVDANVDQHVRLRFRGDVIEAEYTVQLGRQAAFAEVLQIDADRDGRLSTEETARYFAQLEKTIRTGLELRVDGRDIPWRRPAELRLEMPFRKIYRFEAPRGGGSRVEFHNENFASAPGAASIVVLPSEGLNVSTEADPSALGRDLECSVHSGEGRVEQASGRRDESVPVSAAALWLGRSVRGLLVVALLGAGIAAGRGRRVAAVLGLTAAGFLGAAAVRMSVPSEPEAVRVFLALHGKGVRASDATVRRVKPFETRIEPVLGMWGPEFGVRHRWASYATVSHLGHVHPETREYASSFRVSWSDGAWRLTELPGGRSEVPSISASPGVVAAGEIAPP